MRTGQETGDVRKSRRRGSLGEGHEKGRRIRRCEESREDHKDQTIEGDACTLE